MSRVGQDLEPQPVENWGIKVNNAKTTGEAKRTLKPEQSNYFVDNASPSLDQTTIGLLHETLVHSQLCLLFSLYLPH
jgi:hypothetical protein